MPKAAPLLALDRADRGILALLQEDGALSNVEFAQRVALSPSPCLRRVVRFSNLGVIARRVAIVDPKKIDLGLVAHLEVMLDKQAEQARSTFREAVQRWPEALTCYALSGQWDYSLKFIAPGFDHHSRFLLEKALALPVVVNVQSSFVLQTVGETTALPLAHLGLSG